ncbi:MAG: hypothetical protein WA977_13785 [Halobacteriota archaeon]
MATNDTFYGKTKIFVIKSLELLEVIKESEGILLTPQHEKNLITEGSDGGISGTTSKSTQEPDFKNFVSKNWEKIKKLTEYEECQTCMYENKIINKHLGKLVGTAGYGMHIDIDTCLKRLILGMILESGSLKFNEKIFTEYFEKLRNFFTNDKLQFCAFAPLEGFRADIDEIQLDENLRIFKITAQKLEELLNNSGITTIIPITHFLISNLRFGIERIYETDKAIGDELKPPLITPIQETGRIFDEMISVLRLFKPGTVGYIFIRTEALDWNPIGGGSIHSGIFKHPYHGEYRLEKNEVPDFKEFFKKFEHKPKFLDIPLRYFNYAHTRERPEDKLIDYMIAFEGLFVKEKAELRYRLSLRVAAFLGENRDEKGEIFTLMRRAYDLRSDIVHGSSYSKNIEINGEKLSFGELVSWVEELLRKSIKKSIETGQKPDQILENSPESIFV